MSKKIPGARSLQRLVSPNRIRPKPGAMVAMMAQLPGEHSDFFVIAGDGVPRGDRVALLDAMRGVVSELDKRGYDMSTMRLTVRANDIADRRVG